MTVAVRNDLPALWLPLLQRLTDACPSWGIWKNADAALAGSGDMDSAAPESDWQYIEDTFRAWAVAHDLGPVTACRHVRGVLFLLALDRPHGCFIELDVNARKYFRGWTLFHAEELAPLMEYDPRGFRQLRPGAEGVMLLLGNGVLWGGRPNDAGLHRKRIAEFLQRDPDGVRLTASRLFGNAAPVLVRAAERVARGGWDRRGMLWLEGWTLARALSEPGTAAMRYRTRGLKRVCPVLQTIFGDQRRMPDDIESWVASVRVAHQVHEWDA